MHIKNIVCENIYDTLHQPGKIKDEINTRKDLEHLEIRGKLVPDETNKNNKILLPAPYTLSKKEKKTVLRNLAKCESS